MPTGGRCGSPWAATCVALPNSDAARMQRRYLVERLIVRSCGCARSQISRKYRGGHHALQVPIVPREISLQPIDAIARHRQPVKLIRVDDELRLDAERSERLIHLLTADDRHVE